MSDRRRRWSPESSRRRRKDRRVSREQLAMEEATAAAAAAGPGSVAPESSYYSNTSYPYPSQAQSQTAASSFQQMALAADQHPLPPIDLRSNDDIQIPMTTAAPVPMPMPVPGPSRDRRRPRDRRRNRQGSGSSSNVSYSSSSSSSYLEISRWYPSFGRSGGVLKTFFKTPSEHRPKLRRRRSGRNKKGVFGFGNNSSSSSVNSDMAYGMGFVRKPKGRHFSPRRNEHAASARETSDGRPPRLQRRQTDEEIMEIGRQLAKVARDQNKEDLRAGGKRPAGQVVAAASSWDKFHMQNTGSNAGSSRGLPPSRRSQRHDTSSSDDAEWESASEEESSSDESSGLAYGSVEFDEPPPPAPKPSVSRQSTIVSVRPPGRKSSAVDPKLFGPVNSLRGIVNTPCGFGDRDDEYPDPGPSEPRRASTAESASIEARPLQTVYPMQTSNPEMVEAARPSGSVVPPQPSYLRDQSYHAARSEPVIQAPKPIAPVPMRMYEEERIRDEEPSESPERRRFNPANSKSLVETALVAAGVAGATFLAGRDRNTDKDRDLEQDHHGNYGHNDHREDETKLEDSPKAKELALEKEIERLEKMLAERSKAREQRKRDSKRDSGTEDRRVPDVDADDETRPRGRDLKRSEPYYDYDYDRGRRGEQQPETSRRVSEPSEQPAVVDDVHTRTVENPTLPSSSGIDVFRFQVPDDAFRTRDSPLRPSSPYIIDVTPAPSPDPEQMERRSRRDSFEDEMRDAKHIYDESTRSTAPISAVVMAAAIAATEHSHQLDEPERGRTSAKQRDAIQEEADRYYHARRMAEREVRSRSRSHSPEPSVVGRYAQEQGAEIPRIVTPPEMLQKPQKNMYSEPNADVEFDHLMSPKDHVSFTPVECPVRDPFAERPRPVLTLVIPTPVPTPSPENERERSSEKAAETVLSDAPDIMIGPRGEVIEVVTASPDSKRVSWGPSETKQYEVETPERSRERPVDFSETPKRSAMGDSWDDVASAAAGAAAAAAILGDDESDQSEHEGRADDIKSNMPLDTSRSSPPRDRKVLPKGLSSRVLDEEPEDAPPAPGPKPASPRSSQMPGAFADDLDFAATLAAGLQDSGFDPNIVIDDDTYRRRESPPGLSEPTAVYMQPFVETVPDLGVVFGIDQGVPVPEPGHIIGEVAETPASEKGPPLDDFEGAFAPLGEPKPDETRHIEHDYTDAIEEPVVGSPKFSKKEQHRFEKASRDAQLAEEEGRAAQPVESGDDMWEDAPDMTRSKRSSTKSMRSSAGWDDADTPVNDRRVSIPVDDSDDVEGVEASDDFWEEPRDSGSFKPNPKGYDIPEENPPGRRERRREERRRPQLSESSDRGASSIKSDKRYDDRSSDPARDYDTSSDSKRRSKPVKRSSKDERRGVGGLWGRLKGSNGGDGGKESKKGSAGTLGAGAGIAGAALGAAIAAGNLPSSSDAAGAPSRQEEPYVIMDVDQPAAQRADSVSSQENLLLDDPDIVPRVIKPAIDPQYGDFLPLPPSPGGADSVDPFIDDDLPALPDSRPATPPGQEKAFLGERSGSSQKRPHSLHSRRGSTNETPSKSPSHTAIPIQFRMGPRTSMPPVLGMPRTPPITHTSPAFPSQETFPITKRRSRPNSNSWDRPMTWDASREIRPLYLLERSRSGEQGHDDTPETTPLPPSTESTESSAPESGHDEEPEAAPLIINTAAAQAAPLGSEESTPKGAEETGFNSPASAKEFEFISPEALGSGQSGNSLHAWGKEPEVTPPEGQSRSSLAGSDYATPFESPGENSEARPSVEHRESTESTPDFRDALDAPADDEDTDTGSPKRNKKGKKKVSQTPDLVHAEKPQVQSYFPSVLSMLPSLGVNTLLGRGKREELPTSVDEHANDMQARDLHSEAPGQMADRGVLSRAEASEASEVGMVSPVGSDGQGQPPPAASPRISPIDAPHSSFDASDASLPNDSFAVHMHPERSLSTDDMRATEGVVRDVSGGILGSPAQESPAFIGTTEVLPPSLSSHTTIDDSLTTTSPTNKTEDMEPILETPADTVDWVEESGPANFDVPQVPVTADSSAVPFFDAQRDDATRDGPLSKAVEESSSTTGPIVTPPAVHQSGEPSQEVIGAEPSTSSGAKGKEREDSPNHPLEEGVSESLIHEPEAMPVTFELPTSPGAHSRTQSQDESSQASSRQMNSAAAASRRLRSSRVGMSPSNSVDEYVSSDAAHSGEDVPTSPRSTTSSGLRSAGRRYKKTRSLRSSRRSSMASSQGSSHENEAAPVEEVTGQPVVVVDDVPEQTSDEVAGAPADRQLDVEELEPVEPIAVDGPVLRQPENDDGPIAKQTETVEETTPSQLEVSEELYLDQPVIVQGPSVARPEVDVEEPPYEEAEVVEQSPSMVGGPSSMIEESSSAFEKPASTTEESSSAVEKPASMIEEPLSAVEKPASMIQESFSTFEGPSAVEGPSSAIEEPSSAIQEPSSAIEEPSSAKEGPSSAVEGSSSVVEEPSLTIEEPSLAVEEPSSVVEGSSSAKEGPSSAVERPSSAVERPSSVVEEPSSVIEEPSSVVEEPSSAIDKPSLMFEVPLAAENPSSIVEGPSLAVEEPPLIIEEPLTLEKPSSAVKELPLIVEEPALAAKHSSVTEEPSSAVEKSSSVMDEPSTTFETHYSAAETPPSMQPEILETPVDQSQVPSELNESPATTIGEAQHKEVSQTPSRSKNDGLVEVPDESPKPETFADKEVPDLQEPTLPEGSMPEANEGLETARDVSAAEIAQEQRPQKLAESPTQPSKPDKVLQDNSQQQVEDVLFIDSEGQVVGSSSDMKVEEPTRVAARDESPVRHIEHVSELDQPTTQLPVKEEAPTTARDDLSEVQSPELEPAHVLVQTENPVSPEEAIPEGITPETKFSRVFPEETAAKELVPEDSTAASVEEPKDDAIIDEHIQSTDAAIPAESDSIPQATDASAEPSQEELQLQQLPSESNDAPSEQGVQPQFTDVAGAQGASNLLEPESVVEVSNEPFEYVQALEPEAIAEASNEPIKSVQVLEPDASIGEGNLSEISTVQPENSTSRSEGRPEQALDSDEVARHEAEAAFVREEEAEVARLRQKKKRKSKDNKRISQLMANAENRAEKPDATTAPPPSSEAEPLGLDIPEGGVVKPEPEETIPGNYSEEGNLPQAKEPTMAEQSASTERSTVVPEPEQILTRPEVTSYAEDSVPNSGEVVPQSDRVISPAKLQPAQEETPGMNEESQPEAFEEAKPAEPEAAKVEVAAEKTCASHEAVENSKSEKPVAESEEVADEAAEETHPSAEGAQVKEGPITEVQTEESKREQPEPVHFEDSAQLVLPEADVSLIHKEEAELARLAKRETHSKEDKAHIEPLQANAERQAQESEASKDVEATDPSQTEGAASEYPESQLVQDARNVPQSQVEETSSNLQADSGHAGDSIRPQSEEATQPQIEQDAPSRVEIPSFDTDIPVDQPRDDTTQELPQDHPNVSREIAGSPGSQLDNSSQAPFEPISATETLQEQDEDLVVSPTVASIEQPIDVESQPEPEPVSPTTSKDIEKERKQKRNESISDASGRSSEPATPVVSTEPSAVELSELDESAPVPAEESQAAPVPVTSEITVMEHGQPSEVPIQEDNASENINAGETAFVQPTKSSAAEPQDWTSSKLDRSSLPSTPLVEGNVPATVAGPEQTSQITELNTPLPTMESETDPRQERKGKISEDTLRSSGTTTPVTLDDVQQETTSVEPVDEPEVDKPIGDHSAPVEVTSQPEIMSSPAEEPPSTFVNPVDGSEGVAPIEDRSAPLEVTNQPDIMSSPAEEPPSTSIDPVDDSEVVKPIEDRSAPLEVTNQPDIISSPAEEPPSTSVDPVDDSEGVKPIEDRSTPLEVTNQPETISSLAEEPLPTSAKPIHESEVAKPIADRSAPLEVANQPETMLNIVEEPPSTSVEPVIESEVVKPIENRSAPLDATSQPGTMSSPAKPPPFTSTAREPESAQSESPDITTAEAKEKEETSRETLSGTVMPIEGSGEISSPAGPDEVHGESVSTKKPDKVAVQTSELDRIPSLEQEVEGSGSLDPDSFPAAATDSKLEGSNTTAPVASEPEHTVAASEHSSPSGRKSGGWGFLAGAIAGIGSAVGLSGEDDRSFQGDEQTKDITTDHDPLQGVERGEKLPSQPLEPADVVEHATKTTLGNEKEPLRNISRNLPQQQTSTDVVTAEPETTSQERESIQDDPFGPEMTKSENEEKMESLVSPDLDPMKLDRSDSQSLLYDDPKQDEHVSRQTSQDANTTSQQFDTASRELHRSEPELQPDSNDRIGPVAEREVDDQPRLEESPPHQAAEEALAKDTIPKSELEGKVDEGGDTLIAEGDKLTEDASRSTTVQQDWPISANQDREFAGAADDQPYLEPDSLIPARDESSPEAFTTPREQSPNLSDSSGPMHARTSGGQTKADIDIADKIYSGSPRQSHEIEPEIPTSAPETPLFEEVLEKQPVMQSVDSTEVAEEVIEPAMEGSGELSPTRLSKEKRTAQKGSISASEPEATTPDAEEDSQRAVEELAQPQTTSEHEDQAPVDLSISSGTQQVDPSQQELSHEEKPSGELANVIDQQDPERSLDMQDLPSHLSEPLTQSSQEEPAAVITTPEGAQASSNQPMESDLSELQGPVLEDMPVLSRKLSKEEKRKSKKAASASEDDVLGRPSQPQAPLAEEMQPGDKPATPSPAIESDPAQIRTSIDTQPTQDVTESAEPPITEDVVAEDEFTAPLSRKQSKKDKKNKGKQPASESTSDPQTLLTEEGPVHGAAELSQQFSEPQEPLENAPEDAGEFTINPQLAEVYVPVAEEMVGRTTDYYGEPTRRVGHRSDEVYIPEAQDTVGRSTGRSGHRSAEVYVPEAQEMIGQATEDAGEPISRGHRSAEVYVPVAQEMLGQDTEQSSMPTSRTKHRSAEMYVPEAETAAEEEGATTFKDSWEIPTREFKENKTKRKGSLVAGSSEARMPVEDEASGTSGGAQIGSQSPDIEGRELQRRESSPDMWNNDDYFQPKPDDLDVSPRQTFNSVEINPAVARELNTNPEKPIRYDRPLVGLGLIQRHSSIFRESDGHTPRLLTMTSGNDSTDSLAILDDPSEPDTSTGMDSMPVPEASSSSHDEPTTPARVPYVVTGRDFGFAPPDPYQLTHAPPAQRFIAPNQEKDRPRTPSTSKRPSHDDPQQRPSPLDVKDPAKKGGVAALAQKFGSVKKAQGEINQIPKSVDQLSTQEKDNLDEPALWEEAQRNPFEGSRLDVDSDNSWAVPDTQLEDAQLDPDMHPGPGASTSSHGRETQIGDDNVSETRSHQSDSDARTFTPQIPEPANPETEIHMEEPVVVGSPVPGKYPTVDNPTTETQESVVSPEKPPDPDSGQKAGLPARTTDTILNEFLDTPHRSPSSQSSSSVSEKSVSLGDPIVASMKTTEDDTLSARPPSAVSFRRSLSSVLPPVQEEPQEDESEARKGDCSFSPGSVTPDINRDSGFVTDSPTLPRLRQSDTMHQHRDSGVHMRDSPGTSPKLLGLRGFSPQPAQLSQSYLADEGGKPEDKPFKQPSPAGSDTQQLARDANSIRESQEPPVTPEPQRSRSKSPKKYPALGPSPAKTPAAATVTGSAARLSSAREILRSPASSQRSVSDMTDEQRATPEPQRRRVGSNSAMSRTRTPEPLNLRSESSSVFRHSGTPPLRSRRTRSGDLRTLGQSRSRPHSHSYSDLDQLDLDSRASPAASVSPASAANNPAHATHHQHRPSTPSRSPTSSDLRSATTPPAAASSGASAAAQTNSTPVANEGRVRAKDMADVYDGFGEGRLGSPRSPTRPHSMRRRQSMQVLELESRVDQLIAENRALQEARAQAQFQNTSQASSTLADRDTEIEALKQNLDFMRKEIQRLTEVNEGLNSAIQQTAVQYDDRYRLLESQHADATRELHEHRQNQPDYDEANHMIEEKDAEIRSLREQLEATKDHIREMQAQILAAKSADSEFLRIKDVDYFDHRCQQLCSHVQQWVLRFSKFSDMRACRLTNELNDEKIIDRLDNAVLDGSNVDHYLNDRIRRRDIFMSLTMTMIWEFVFTRYLFGMDREQRQKLKTLEKLLFEVGPSQAVRQWRAVTLTLLCRREQFKEQRDHDTEAVVQAIFQTLCMILPPPSHLEDQIQNQLRRVMREAVDLSIEMRTQRAEYMMLPPLQPDYDANGDLAEPHPFNAALMNERSPESNRTADDLEAEGAIACVVLFPLVVKKGDDGGVGDDEIVVCPAQVIVSRPRGKSRQSYRSDAGGVSLMGRGAGSSTAGSRSNVSMRDVEGMEGAI